MVEYKQPECNIGLTGHVDHGKTTLVAALSGVWAARHSEELKRGITIKLGYADTTFRRCPECPPPECFTTKEICPIHNIPTIFLRKISFVDAPGHESLMATMLSGAALMDGAILVIAANEECPQPQTREHLVALEIIGIKNIVIVQNKIDAVDKQKAIENYNQILSFIKGTIAENAPIIPISSIYGTNIDYLIQVLEDRIKTPPRDSSKPARMYIARSFDINKPGIRPMDLKGGVLGGSLIQGRLRVGDEIEISPGLKVEQGGKVYYEPIYTYVSSLMAGGHFLEEVGPGGLIGVGTYLDPTITKADGLVGNIVGKPGTLPPIQDNLTIKFSLLERAVGTKELHRVEQLKPRENLMLVVGSAVTLGTVASVHRDEVNLILKRPVCAESGMRVAISRMITGRWRLIGYGYVQ
ncbi:MAG: translation initiation factor IF-2 subunit gamma [Candidatus Methanomethyliaceae archaeon]|nr:translation initiation factor IF-2 subunit gamma [Candidatus Methanomethyliaceae archaeon]MDW7970387.1 translation initiation factor IF-2 subunit gamma [Nitrososphaerota archaeon]